MASLDEMLKTFQILLLKLNQSQQQLTEPTPEKVTPAPLPLQTEEPVENEQPEFDINVYFDPRLLDTLNTVQTISLLLQPSPCDSTTDSLIETLVNADAAVMDDDPNRSVRLVLSEHLLKLRDERCRVQLSVEEYVKVLKQLNDDEREARKTREFYERNKARFEANELEEHKSEIEKKQAQDKSLESSKQQKEKHITYPKKDEEKQRELKKKESLIETAKEVLKATGSNSDDGILEATKKLLEALLSQEDKKERDSRERRGKSRRRRSTSSSASDDEKRKQRGKEHRLKLRHRSRPRDSQVPTHTLTMLPTDAMLQQPPPQPQYYDYYTGQPIAVSMLPQVLQQSMSVPPPTMIFPPGQPDYSAPPPMAPIKVSSILPSSRLPSVPPVGTKIMDLRSMYVKCARDDKWSKFLIRNLKDKNADSEEIQAVFDECISNENLINDYNGCYVMKCLFEIGSSQQRQQILHRLCAQFKNVVCSLHGFDLIQVVIEKLGETAVVSLAEELRGIVASTARTVNGSNAIELLIASASTEKMKFIVEEIAEAGIFNMSRHQVAHRLVECVVKNFSNENKHRLYRDMLPFLQQMATDSMANYVVQTSLDTASNENLRSLIKQLLNEDFMLLAQHKYACNVHTKCVELANKEELSAMVEKILENYSENTQDNFPLMEMLLNRNSSLVCERLVCRLEEMNPTEYAQLMNMLDPHIAYLSSVPRMKRILSKHDEHRRTHKPPPKPQAASSATPARPEHQNRQQPPRMSLLSGFIKSKDGPKNSQAYYDDNVDQQKDWYDEGAETDYHSFYQQAYQQQRGAQAAYSESRAPPAYYDGGQQWGSSATRPSGSGGYNGPPPQPQAPYRGAYPTAYSTPTAERYQAGGPITYPPAAPAPKPEPQPPGNTYTSPPVNYYGWHGYRNSRQARPLGPNQYQGEQAMDIEQETEPQNIYQQNFGPN